jgi:hypothetical protein
MKSNANLLIENNDVREKRISFVGEISRFRREENALFTWANFKFFSFHTVGKSWSDDSSKGLHFRVSKGERLIIIIVRRKNCFVENALLMRKARSNTGDNHR